MKLRIRADVREVKRDLRRVQRFHEQAAVQSLNSTNRRFIKPRIVKAVKAMTGARTAKSIRRQVRIPRSFLAKRGRLRSGGLFDISLPLIIHAAGEAFQIRKSVKVYHFASEPFKATVRGKAGRGGNHTGWFARVVGESRREWREQDGRRYRTELPIAELFTDVSGKAQPLVRAILSEAAVYFGTEFRRQFERRVSGLNAKRAR